MDRLCIGNANTKGERQKIKLVGLCKKNMPEIFTIQLG